MRSDDVRLVAWAEARARWRSHAVIGLLAAATVAAAIVATTAADRSETAFARLRAATNASDISIVMAGDDPLVEAERLRAVEGVTDVRAMHLYFVRPLGSDLFPDYTLLSIAPHDVGDRAAIDQPVIVSGRAPDPARAEEIALSEGLARSLGVEVNDELVLESMTEQFVIDLYEGRGDFFAPPDGPRIVTRVTGIARSPAEFGNRPNVIHLTPGFVNEYGERINRYDVLNAQLTATAFARAERGELDLADEATEVQPSQFFDSGSTADGLGTIASTLRIVGAVAVLAGLIAVSLALLRSARSSAADRSILAALGWTRGRQLHALVWVTAPWVVGGFVAGVVGGIVLSPHAIVGLASATDPEQGAIIVNTPLLIVVATVSLGLLAIALAGVAWLAVTRNDVAGRPTGARGNRLGRPLGVTIGVRHALFGTPARGGRANRAALGATTLGVAAALAALVVSASIARLQTDGELFGQGPGRSVESGESTDALDQALAVLEVDERVARLEVLHITFDIRAEGARELTTIALDTLRGQPVASLTGGRLPSAANEVAMGPQTLDDLDRSIGDEVDLEASDGRGSFRIVGAVLFPEGDFRHDDGAVLTTDGAERLIGDPRDSAQIHLLDFDWAEGVDAAAADRGLIDQGLPVFTTQTALLPGTVTNLGQVEDLPRYLALFVGLLSLATLLHATWVGVSLRTRELATLSAIGTTRRTNASIVATQALVLVAVSAVVGAPLGTALGRQMWQQIADGAHVVASIAVPWAWFGGAIGAVIGMGVGLAAIAALRVRSVHPAAALRAE